MKKNINFYPDIWIGLFIALAIFVIYGQAYHFEYINLDDPFYITDNRYVYSGLTGKNISWAFLFKNSDFKTYWHPLTWLSHMLDSQLFGLDPGMHHIINIIFHTANSLLLFIVFKRMTGARWQSAFVAALFALHPLNVESVAWVAERKNVLSTFFWMLTMHAYVVYTERPALSRYLFVVFFFTLGLLAKPMLVTLPCVLFLMDYWPLGRLQLSRRIYQGDGAALGYPVQGTSYIRLVWEKIPLLSLAIAATYLSSSVLKSLKEMATVAQVPMGLRLSNALVTYVKYILKMFWPQKLTVFYPLPEHIPLWQAIGAVLFLGGVTIWATRWIKERPYLGIGWLWYLGTLVPVSGLVQAGLWPEMADRWAYVPLIGLFIMMVWFFCDVFSDRRYKKISVSILGGLILLLLSAASWNQIRFWQNSITLFQHALAVNNQNLTAHYNISAAWQDRGAWDEAIRHYREILRLGRNDYGIHGDMGTALAAKGHIAEAVKHFNEALRLSPRSAETHSNFGTVWANQGQSSKAEWYFREALRLDPDYAPAHYNLGNVLFGQGKPGEAIYHFSEAVRIKPNFMEAYNNLAIVLVQVGKLGEAIKYCSAALRINPNEATIKKRLIETLADKKKMDISLNDLQERLKLNPEDPALNRAMGDLCKKRGELDKAILYYQIALDSGYESLELMNQLAVAYASRGHYEKARFVLMKAVSFKPNRWEAYYYMAGTYARQNKIEEATNWLKKAVNRGFNNWDSLKADKNMDRIRETLYYKELMRSR